MKIKDIIAGTGYATCDGKLVVPVSPVERAWVTGYDDEKRAYVVSRVQETDPWGGCNPSGRRRGPRPADVGIRCERYDFDRDGVQLKDTAEIIVVKPIDVKGTWADYLVLYADKVRKTVDARTNRERHGAIATDLEEALRRAFGSDVLFVGVHSRYDGTSETRRVQDIAVHINIRDREQWRRFAEEVANNGVYFSEAAQLAELLPESKDADED